MRAAWMGFAMAAMAAVLAVLPAHAEENPALQIEALTPAQAKVARDMIAYRDAMEKKLIGLISKYNGSAVADAKSWSMEKADHAVKVYRGPVIEKAGWYVNTQKQGMPPFVPDPAWNQYFEINIHPKSPLAGFFHGTTYLMFFKNGTSALAGYLDVTPATWIDSDVAELKAAVEGVFKKHKRDIGPYRQELCESEFGAKHHRDNLKASCTGVSLYARPLMEATPENLAFVRDLYETYLNAYIATLERRKDAVGDAADQARQDDMRRRWFNDQMFADTFSTKVVPFEVWSMANLPPQIKF